MCLQRFGAPGPLHHVQMADQIGSRCRREGSRSSSARPACAPKCTIRSTPACCQRRHSNALLSAKSTVPEAKRASVQALLDLRQPRPA